jgi:chromosome segregation protein
MIRRTSTWKAGRLKAPGGQLGTRNPELGTRNRELETRNSKQGSMKLRKLEIFGFKTFPEPTELVFHGGVTAIVGPNGCGKSNVIDAIRWAMGETSAKGLRGDSMEDVIFSGSEARKALNFAEVTLTLSDVEGGLPGKFGSFHEVGVTRRLHRSGESEYLINKIPCRLKDVTELFMDTGVGRRAYSVVEQGRIDAILSAKPQDRRHLIEEAAGITKYKSRKEEAVRKMDDTAQNLERLGDVLSEVRREMNALKRQAARAQEFKALRAERRELERHLLVAAWLALDLEHAQTRARAQEMERELASARAEADRLGARIEEGRLTLLEDERALEASQRQVYHCRSQISERENRTESLEREGSGLASSAARAREEGAECVARREALEGDLAGVEGERADVEARLAARAGEASSLQQAHEDALRAQREAERSLEAEKKELMRVLGELTRLNHALDHGLRQEEEAKRRLSGAGRQEAELVGKLRELEDELREREAQLGGAEEARSQAVGERLEVEEKLKGARARRQELARQAEQARKAHQTEQSRLKGLEQLKDSLEWYGAGVKAILGEARRSEKNGIHGVVADAIAAPVEYESALEASLGERLQYVIVEDPERGLAAVQHLKRVKAGRSSFVPVNSRPKREARFPDVSEPWARGRLLDLLHVAPEYRELAHSLLGDVFVVETLENALDVWQRNGIHATLVTLDGETLSPEGVISGGTGRQEGGGLLHKNRQIRELRDRVASLSGESSALEGALQELDRESEELQARAEATREEVHRRELQVAHLGKDLAQLRERRERLQERREAMEYEREDLAAALQKLAREGARLEEEKRAGLRSQEEVEGRLEALRGAEALARSRAQDAHGSLMQQKVEEASDRQRLEGLRERERTLRTSLENVARRAERLARDVEEAVRVRAERVEEGRKLRRELEVLRADLARTEGELGGRMERLESRRAELGSGEKKAAAARRRAEEIQRAYSEAELSVREVSLRVEDLCGRFRERQQADVREEAASGLPETFETSSSEHRVRVLDEKLAAFGELNLLAIEEYAEKKERYAFLETQRKDLEESLESLKQAIQRINRVSRERFAEAFEQVSRTFQEVYPRIFRGGEARLVLTDSENLLETGIEIIARPPGKRPQHISLLSGGEKALTAVALIFSIFLVKPSPFCILDEVDAPLDEANIGRFTEMVKGMATSSQFLIITHNKSTMEAADHLYGVTASEPGVSRAVSVRLSAQEAA